MHFIVCALACLSIGGYARRAQTYMEEWAGVRDWKSKNMIRNLKDAINDAELSMLRLMLKEEFEGLRQPEGLAELIKMIANPRCQESSMSPDPRAKPYIECRRNDTAHYRSFHVGDWKPISSNALAPLLLYWGSNQWTMGDSPNKAHAHKLKRSIDRLRRSLPELNANASNAGEDIVEGTPSQQDGSTLFQTTSFKTYMTNTTYQSPQKLALPSPWEASSHRQWLQNPVPQALLCLIGYFFHICILSRHSFSIDRFGFWVGWDTCVGLAILASTVTQRAKNGHPMFPSHLAEIELKERGAASFGDFSQASLLERSKLLHTCGIILVFPLLLQRFLGDSTRTILTILRKVGVSSADHLLSAELLSAQLILNLLLAKIVTLRHPDFFSKRFLRWSWSEQWLSPVLRGYTVSVALFNLVEYVNQALLPDLGHLPEGIVAQLVKPSDGKAFSLLLASLAPCIGAPFFEEIQWRAFMLQSLTAKFPWRKALLIQAVLFAAAHGQIGLVLPLTILGVIWGILYISTGNLLVPILIHFLWNARVFIGSRLAL